MPPAALTSSDAHTTGPVSWLRRRDPGLAAIRRAARVTVAASVGFYVCLYVVGGATAAVYALFAAVALGALSEISGPPAKRTRTFAGALLAGLLLATLGTLLAGSTWAAAAGMLVVGFVVAYSGVGGPRLAGVANGLQLFYILPCFPPYAPDTLDERLVGLLLGGVLMAVADRVLWPAPAPPDFGRRVADAAGAAAEYAMALRAALFDPAQLAPAAGSDPGLAVLRDDARRAAAGLRLSNLPVLQRPTGPGLRDRCHTRAAAAVRVLVGRLGGVADVFARPDMPHASTETAELVGVVGDVLAAVRDALRDAGPAPSTDALDTALAAHLERRVQRLADGSGTPPRMRVGLTAIGLAEAARSLVLATRGAVGAPPPAAADTPADFWFLHAPRWRLWWHRLSAHLTPRSVYLQNAVRLALGLAVARVVAGVLDLTHGFWVLLATLVLMRTSAIAGRAALFPAFTGTVVGAVVAGGVLTIVGYDTAVYAAVLPVLMIAAFTAGPVLGIAAGQAGFTVVVALVFAQVAPADWRLAEARVLDVVVGGVVGALIGAAVWPRGGGGELRRIAAECLGVAADEIVATIAVLTGSGPREASAGPDLRRLAALFEQTYAQHRSEPLGPGPEPDWLTVLGVVHRVVGYARTLRIRHPVTGPLPWPQVADRLRATAAEVAGAYRDAAAAVRSRGAPPIGAAEEHRSRPATEVPGTALTGEPEEALLVLDAWGWLQALADDLEQVEQAFGPSRPVSPPPAGVPRVGQRTGRDEGPEPTEQGGAG